MLIVNRNIHRLICTIVASIFSISVIMPANAYAQPVFSLPAPGAMVSLSNAFSPIVIKGIEIFPEDPFKFNFYVDTGESNISEAALQEESSKLIKYFLASLTVPENDMWVNLSPYEKDRIIPDAFGVTEMGRDLLAQDYLLKQITASMLFPEKHLGEIFWNKIYEKAYEEYGVKDIDVSTFNKVWIIPEKAVVYEHENSAFVIEQHLKVLVEEDYLALQDQIDQDPKLKNTTSTSGQLPLATKIIKELIIPELEKEVNEGSNFANLRQIYHSMILATWFKRNLKASILGKVYVGKNKIGGVDIEDKEAKKKIYDQYLEAFKIGVYNTIKEDYDPVTQEIIERKYTSGGIFGSHVEKVFEETSNISEEQSTDIAMLAKDERLKQVSSTLNTKTDAKVQIPMNYGIYSGAQYANGEIIGGEILNPQGAEDLRQFRLQLNLAPQGFTGIIRIVLPQNGRLWDILGENCWTAWLEYSNKPVSIIFQKGKITSVFDENNNNIYPFDKNFIHENADYKDGKITGGILLNPNGERANTQISIFLRDNPDFTGVIDRVFLGSKGDLQKFHNGEVAWTSMVGYENHPVSIVIVEGKVTEVFSQTGKHLFPFTENKIYQNAKFVNGEIVDGEVLFPEGARDLKKLRSQLENVPLDFSGVLKVEVPENGTLDNILGNNIWTRWSEYSNKTVFIVFDRGKITDVYNENNERIAPFDNYFIFPDTNYHDDQLDALKAINPNGERQINSVNAYLRKNPNFSGIIHRVPLNKRGGLTNFHNKKVGWSTMPGYEYHPVSIIMKEGEIIEILDEKGTRVYPFDKNLVYVGATFDNGRIIGGNLVTPVGLSNRQALNQIILQNKDFSGVIIKVPLGESGGLTYFGNQIKVWAEMEGYENELVTVVMEKGEVNTVIDKENNIIYKKKEKKKENIVYPGAIYEKGKIVGGNALNEDGTVNGYELNKIIAGYENFSGVIDRVKLDMNGGLTHFLGNNLFGGMAGYAYEYVTVVLVNGEIAGIYDKDNKEIYPFNDNFIYENATYENGAIIGETTNPQGSQRRNYIETHLKENPNFTGVIKTRLYSNGGIPSYIDENGWTTMAGFENMPVIVVKVNGETIGIFDEKGEQIFPNQENYVYRGGELINGKVSKGDLLTPAGTSSRLVLNNILTENPDFTGHIAHVRLLPNGSFGKINGILYREAINGYANQLVTLRLENGRVIAAYNVLGDPIWAEEKSVIGEEILNDLWKSGDFERLLDLFGEERTNRLLFHFFDTVTPLQLITFTQIHFKKKLDENKKNPKHFQPKTPSEIIKDLSHINLLQKKPANEEFQSVLAHELFSLIYFNISQDYRYLDKIQEEIESNQFNGILRQAFVEVVATYQTLKDYEINGIRTNTKLKFYQKFGVKAILTDKRVLLGDKPGLGKTLQALAAAINAYDGKGAEKVFIVCPSVSIDNTWIRDINKHLKGQHNTFVVKTRKDLDSPKKLEQAKNAKFIIANYEILRGPEAKDLRDKLKELGIDFIIADEGHRMKNDSQITESIQDFDAEYKILISASAQQGRSIGKVFNLLHWLYPEKYPYRSAFLRKYNTTEGIKRLKSELKGFMLRRHISDVLSDLPDLHIDIYPVELTPEQTALYREVEQNYLISENSDAPHHDSFGPFRNLINAAIDTASIRDISFRDVVTDELYPVGAGMYNVNINGVECKISFKYPASPTVSYTNTSGETISYALKDKDRIEVNGKALEIMVKERVSHSAKYKALDNIVNNVVEVKGESLAIFSGSRKTVSSLQKRYEKLGHEVYVIHGNVSKLQRKRILNKFNKADKPMILISTYQTLGESVDITGARHGVLVDSPWLEREQIISRLYRLGQTKDVYFTILLAKDTIDEHIEKVNWLSDMIKSIVLDDSFHMNTDTEMAKSFIAHASESEENFSKLKEFQNKIRTLQEENEKSSQSISENFADYTDGTNRVSLFNDQFDAELTDVHNEPLYISGFRELLNNADQLSPDSKKALSNFFIKSFDSEKQNNFRVKDMLLWHICNEFIPGFDSIDYDGNLEFIVELGTHILRKLISDPDISNVELKSELENVPEKLYNKTMHYMDTSNILKLFSLLGVIPQTYYYEGALLKYENTISINYSNGRIKYWDKQIVENIAPNWAINDPDIPEEYQGYERDSRRVRTLDESEIKRLANQIRLGNKSAEEVLVSSYLKELKQIAKRAIYGGSLEKVYGNKIRGAITIDELISFGQQELVALINEYAEKEIYYNKGLREYMKENLNRRMYSEAFRIARIIAELQGDNDVFGNEVGRSTTLLEIQSVDAVGSSQIESAESKTNFRELLTKAKYAKEEIDLLELSVFDFYTEEELAQEHAEKIGQDPSDLHLQYVQALIDSFHSFIISFGEDNARRLIENGFKKPGSIDAAMLGEKEVGGIDLNPNKLEIETRGSISYNNFSNYDITIFQSPAFTGFDPVILNIIPVTNISTILSGYIK